MTTKKTLSRPLSETPAEKAAREQSYAAAMRFYMRLLSHSRRAPVARR
jgi:hypothetical protein